MKQVLLSEIANLEQDDFVLRSMEKELTVTSVLICQVSIIANALWRVNMHKIYICSWPLI